MDDGRRMDRRGNQKTGRGHRTPSRQQAQDGAGHRDPAAYGGKDDGRDETGRPRPISRPRRQGASAPTSHVPPGPPAASRKQRRNGLAAPRREPGGGGSARGNTATRWSTRRAICTISSVFVVGRVGPGCAVAAARWLPSRRTPAASHARAHESPMRHRRRRRGRGRGRKKKGGRGASR